MSINIYIGKDNLPPDKKFIYDVDTFFTGIILRDEPFTKKVLREVEQASFVDGEYFKDRFGRMLPIACLSTSSKLLLIVARYRNFVVNCSEVGKNAVDLLLEVPDVMLYFKSSFFAFRGAGKCDAFVNGVHCSDVEEINYRISLCEESYVCQ